MVTGAAQTPDSALPFLPSCAVTNVYLLAGILVFGFLFILCAYLEMPDLKIKTPLCEERGLGIFQRFC